MIMPCVPLPNILLNDVALQGSDGYAVNVGQLGQLTRYEFMVVPAFYAGFNPTVAVLMILIKMER